MQHNKIEEILNSVNGLQAATPKPFLATRVNAAINNATNTANNTSILQWLTKPAIAFSIIVLVITINFFAVQQNNDDITDVDMEETIANNDINELSGNIWNDNNLNNYINEK